MYVYRQFVRQSPVLLRQSVLEVIKFKKLVPTAAKVTTVPIKAMHGGRDLAIRPIASWHFMGFGLGGKVKFIGANLQRISRGIWRFEDAHVRCNDAAAI